MNKPKIIKSFDKLTDEFLEQLKLAYPKGFFRHLVSFSDKDGIRQKGLPFETEETIYLIRMSPSRAKSIIEMDDDFDDEGNLKSKAKEKLTEKQDDLDFLELNENVDNSIDFEDDEDDED